MLHRSHTSTRLRHCPVEHQPGQPGACIHIPSSSWPPWSRESYFMTSWLRWETPILSGSDIYAAKTQSVSYFRSLLRSWQLILCWTIEYHFASVHDFGCCVEEQAMSANGCHAGLVVAVLLSFCTFGRCTVLTFGRTENSITLRCVSDLQNQFPIPNAIFFVRTPDSSSRQRVQNFTRGQEQRSHEITFTLTPETEGNFSCRNSTAANVFSEELLLAGKVFPHRVQLNSKCIL